ncbi:MAG: hypothetical protein HQL76_11030 [Magnetococcales bacterium]|nr:hypothetical protein [Magnetococcales bacterium]
MDVGFRLGPLASSRKFVLSVEVLWALLEEDQTSDDFRFYMDGHVPLKGVRGGEPYPVFWLDLATEPPAEDSWTGLKPIPHADCNKINDLCQRFIGMDDNLYLRPFFKDENIPEKFLDLIYRQSEL